MCQEREADNEQSPLFSSTKMGGLLRNCETRKSDEDPSSRESDVAIKVDKPHTYKDALIGKE